MAEGSWGSNKTLYAALLDQVGTGLHTVLQFREFLQPQSHGASRSPTLLGLPDVLRFCTMLLELPRHGRFAPCCWIRMEGDVSGGVGGRRAWLHAVAQGFLQPNSHNVPRILCHSVFFPQSPYTHTQAYTYPTSSLPSLSKLA